jgi:hypothetical protein
MSIGLVAKVALIAAMAIASIWGDVIISPEGGDSSPCSGGNEGSFACCVWQCRHDSSTGCNGAARCRENVCR